MDIAAGSAAPGPGHLARRTLLGGVGVTLGSMLAGCGDDSAAGGSSGPGTAFTWTDARGKRIRLSRRPRRVVAQSSVAATLLDDGFRVDGVYGELNKTDGSLDYQAGRLDPADLTVVGRTYGQFDLEKYAALRPDLLIDLSFDDSTLWYVPKNVSGKVASIAPTLGIRMQGYDLPPIIEEFLRLARRLGADTDSAAIARAKAAYDRAVAEVRRAAAAAPGLRAVAVSREADDAYFADAAQHPDLALLKKLGVHFPDIDAKLGTYFVQISWEQIDRYPADVIIYDAREASAVAAAVKKIATWNRLPAVQAGQVYPWYPAAPYSYRSYAPLYRRVAGWLRSSRVLSR